MLRFSGIWEGTVMAIVWPGECPLEMSQLRLSSHALHRDSALSIDSKARDFQFGFLVSWGCLVTFYVFKILLFPQSVLLSPGW